MLSALLICVAVASAPSCSTSSVIDRGAGEPAEDRVLSTVLPGSTVSPRPTATTVPAASPVPTSVAEPSTTNIGWRTFTHSSGAFAIDIPAGWQTDELGADYPQLIVSPNVVEYQDSWLADGVYLAVVSAPAEEFLALADENIAAEECRELERVTSEESPMLEVSVYYDFGSPAPVEVRLLWNQRLKIGVLVFHQSDSQPSHQADVAMLEEMLEALTLG